MISKYFETWNESYGNFLLVVGIIASAAASGAHHYDLLPLLEIRSASTPVRRMTITRPPNLKAKLMVSVTGFASDEGKCLLALYNSESGFNDNLAAIRLESFDIVDRRAQWEVDGLENGKYAVVAVHDRNDNGELDQSKAGALGERYGYSNQARSKNGMPTFQEATFDVTIPGVEIDIELK